MTLPRARPLRRTVEFVSTTAQITEPSPVSDKARARPAPQNPPSISPIPPSRTAKARPSWACRGLGRRISLWVPLFAPVSGISDAAARVTHPPRFSCHVLNRRTTFWSIGMSKQPSPLSCIQHIRVVEQFESRWQLVRTENRRAQLDVREPCIVCAMIPSVANLLRRPRRHSESSQLIPSRLNAHLMPNYGVLLPAATQTTSIEVEEPRPHLPAPHPPVRAWPNRLHVV